MNHTPAPQAFVSPTQQQRAFSLVEVVLAVGVVAFAFVAILGLIPAGLTQFRQAIDTSVCAQIAQRVIMEAQQTDFDVLTDAKNTANKHTDSDNFYTFIAPKVSDPKIRYFDEQGNEVAPASTNAGFNPAALSAAEKRLIIYHVLTRVMINSNVPRTGSSAAGDDGKAIRTLASITVQVAYNPGNAVLAINTGGGANINADPQGNLFWDPSNPQTPVGKNTGLKFKIYSAQVGQNQ